MLHVRALVIGMAAACTLSTFAGAQTAREAGGCAEELYAILERDLKVPALTPLRNGGNIAAESCKTWPYRPSVTLAAIAYDGGVKDEKQLVVAVVNRGTRRVVANYGRTLLEDGFNKVDEHSLQVDAAPYQVAKDIRALALRFNNAASAGSCVNSRSASELTLLVPDGQHLRAILSIDMHQAERVNDFAAPGVMNLLCKAAVFEQS